MGPFLLVHRKVFYTEVCSAGGARGRSYLWDTLHNPGFKGCPQGSSAARLNQLYWRCWALGQQNIPPPLKMYMQNKCCVAGL